MRIDSEIKVSVVGLLLLQVLTSLGAVSLLDRLGPVIEQIQNENVVSIRAVEAMQRALAAPATPGQDETRRRDFAEALTRAEQNVTEEGERSHLQAIARTQTRALSGDADALLETLEHLDALSEINHQNVERSDQRARGLARAGSWAMVILALLSFGLGVVLVRRLTKRVTLPLVELHDAVSRYKEGDLWRRASKLEAPHEIAGLVKDFNDLLDARTDNARSGETSHLHRDRAVLLHLLDALDRAAVVVDGEGTILATSRSALELLDGEGGTELRTCIDEAITDPDAQENPWMIAERRQVEPGLWVMLLETTL